MTRQPGDLAREQREIGLAMEQRLGLAPGQPVPMEAVVPIPATVEFHEANIGRFIMSRPPYILRALGRDEALPRDYDINDTDEPFVDDEGDER